MELWIRSQDGYTLEKIETLQICENPDGTWFFNSGFILGKYKTKERAIEILDEIEERIGLINAADFIKDTSGLISFKNAFGEEKLKGLTAPYQMPKE